jgi:hypothetical protein
MASNGRAPRKSRTLTEAPAENRKNKRLKPCTASWGTSVNMARNTANSIMALKPLTHLVDVAVPVNGVDRIDFIKIKKDYKKWLTNKRKHGIINT